MCVEAGGGVVGGKSPLKTFGTFAVFWRLGLGAITALPRRIPIGTGDVFERLTIR